MSMVHDNVILRYNVDFEKEIMIIGTSYYSNRVGEKVIHELTDIVFSGCIAHIFYNEMKDSVIFDIEEVPMNNFLNKEKDMLDAKRKAGWPIYYEDKEELAGFLQNNNYKAFCIMSSVGLSGWVLAKNMEFITDTLSV